MQKSSASKPAIIKGLNRNSFCRGKLILSLCKEIDENGDSGSRGHEINNTDNSVPVCQEKYGDENILSKPSPEQQRSDLDHDCVAEKNKEKIFNKEGDPVTTESDEKENRILEEVAQVLINEKQDDCSKINPLPECIHGQVCAELHLNDSLPSINEEIEDEVIAATLLNQSVNSADINLLSNEELHLSDTDCLLEIEQEIGNDILAESIIVSPAQEVQTKKSNETVDFAQDIPIEFVVLDDGRLEKLGPVESVNDVANIIESESETNELLIGSTYTKAGNLRKRRKFLYSPKKRKQMKLEKNRKSHSVQEPCSCKMVCNTHFTKDQRKKINEEYWNMSKFAQKSFVLGAIARKPVQRPSSAIVDSRRKESIEYFLKNDEGFSQKVCKIFFLATLGYNKTNDRIVQDMCKETGVSPKTDGRKGKVPHNKIDKTQIIDHIMSFEPSISHYRREHAPNRLYLPSDLTITKMYEDFQKKYTNISCSYELYREEVDKLNISFVKLGHEECEACEYFKQHGHSKENCIETCQQCKDWKSHDEKAKVAREQYTKDKEKVKDKDEVVYSMDLQKVIMLPRLDMFKNVIFSLRLSVFNLTFAPVGIAMKEKLAVIPVLWHDAIRGRKQEDIISALFKFVTSPDIRDMKKLTLWVDNCSAQNKNWALLTFLIYIVNSSFIAAKEITIKYFEAGHTFMSADSFHHLVEKSMKHNKQSKIFDFNDFKEATAAAGKNVKVQVMDLEDFSKWRSLQSIKKVATTENRPYISDFSAVKVNRNSFLLQYKKNFNDESWEELDFLLQKIMKCQIIPEPKKYDCPQGISVARKESLLKLIKGKSAVIPENRMEFWQSLPVSSNDGRIGDEENNEEPLVPPKKPRTNKYKSNS